jgi:ATP-dependent DNA helicase RecG
MLKTSSPCAPKTAQLNAPSKTADPLLWSVQFVPGIGPTLASRLKTHGIYTVIDLLFTAPTHSCRRQICTSLAHQTTSQDIVAEVTIIDQHRQQHSRGSNWVIHTRLGHDQLIIRYFRVTPALKTLFQTLSPGSKIWISGSVSTFQGQWQITHPDYIGSAPPQHRGSEHEIRYSAMGTIQSAQIRKWILHCLTFVKPKEEWLPESWRSAKGFTLPPWHEALYQLHHPNQESDFSPLSPARLRLALDEWFTHLSMLNHKRSQRSTGSFTPLVFEPTLSNQMIEHLPFSLTAGQVTIRNTIQKELRSGRPMARLLQGDVGSGKTVVALSALLDVIEAGYQGTLMAPTDLLATQHAAWCRQVCEDLPISIGLLTGRVKGKARQRLLQELAQGSCHLLIGTHALIQEPVCWQKLGLAIIDEQHRFGVKQRQQLARKGEQVHLLMMSATPIPRTLALAHYGDLDNTVLTEKPANRQPIQTHLISLNRLDQVVERLGHAIKQGERIYWICPLIEAAELDGDSAHPHMIPDLSAAISRFQQLQANDYRVGLVHGRLKGDEKEAAMNDFAEGKLDILVATTVIEVGINVPEATIMIIEHAERFGLSQLHQLRGRVGRGSRASHCLLLHGEPLSYPGYQRLNVMRQSNDGFFIAEQDLRHRGEGDLTGVKQSGMAWWRFLSLREHRDHLPILDDHETQCPDWLMQYTSRHTE